MDSLYQEMLEMRDHLLTRIEMLEDEVEYLTNENMQYSKQLYQIESHINSLFSKVSQFNTNERRLEYQESSEETYKTSKETP